MRRNSQRLYTPGPVNVAPSVAERATWDVNHRSETFRESLRAVERRVGDLYPTDAASVVLPGSSTYALEAAVAAFTADDHQVLVASNGVYGDRMNEIAQATGLAPTVVRSPEFADLDYARLGRAAEEGTYHALLAVHHETSTGMLNDLRELADIARKAGLRLIVDVVSSLGCESMAALRDLDWVAIGSSNKAIEGIPGVGLVTAPTSLWRTGCASRGFSLNLRDHFQRQSSGHVRFTPPVGAVLALQEALGLLAEETVVGRQERYRDELSRYVEGFAELGIERVVPPELNSASIGLFRLPQGASFMELQARLLERDLVIYHGVTEAADDQLRVSSMGHHDAAHVEVLLKAIAESLKHG